MRLANSLISPRLLLAASVAVGIVAASCERQASIGTAPAQKPVAVAAAQVPPQPTPIAAIAAPQVVKTEVSISQDGGTFTVPVIINGAVALKFTLDSGAADVSIPADVVSTLVRSGTVDSSDFIGTQTFVLADGSTVPSTEFRIRSLKVGDLILHNVTASLADPKGPLLLGQSFLKRLSTWSLDNSRGVLVLTALPDAPENAPQVAAPSAPSEVTQPVQREATASSDPQGLQSAAASRVLAFFSTMSSEQDPESLREFYSETVNYFGAPQPLAAVINEKAAFIRRWPTRSYIPRPSEIRVSCSSDASCIVTGVVDWQASNMVTGANSSGAASFKFTVRGGLITSEFSHVLYRNPTTG